MAVLKITEENYEELVAASPVPVLLDFYADWCGPCRMVSPLVDEIGEERTDIRVGKINVDEEGALARRFGVMSIPMLAVVKDGEMVAHVVGARPKDAILALLEDKS